MIHTNIARGRFPGLLIAATAAGVLGAGVMTAPAWAPTCGSSCSNGPVNPPTSMAECKDGGWQAFLDAQGNQAFKSQGDCVSYVQTGGTNG
jgi:hypothetical protein